MKIKPHDPGENAIRSQTAEEEKEFWKIIKNHGLPAHTQDPRSDQPTPFSCGPHSLKHIRRVCELVKPKLMIEIGFNIGWSASMWLTLSETKLISIDISTRQNTEKAAESLKNLYPDRFEFILSDSKSVLPILKKRNIKPDLVFVDGDHTIEGVDNDARVAIELGAPFIFFDDWLPRYGPGTAPAVEKYNLKIIQQMGNMVLTKN